MDKASRESGLRAVPPTFDVVKELNGQAGRLATVYALMLTFFAFTVAAQPIKDGLAGMANPIVAPTTLSTSGLISVGLSAAILIGLVFGGATLAIGLLVVIDALEPAVPAERVLEEQSWAHLLRHKRRMCGVAVALLRLAITALLLVWVIAQLAAFETIRNTTTGDLRPWILLALLFTAGGCWALYGRLARQTKL